MTTLGDAALFELWLTAKDGDAFAELARRHAHVVHDIAARTLRDRTAAEDVVQEALLDLALERTRKPAEVGVAAWLVRFAICRARNWRSSEQCRTRRQWIVGGRRPEETMPNDAAELTEETERALAAADPDERTVLAMRFLHGWDYDQIAAALETSEGAARVRVHRALANVRTRLGANDEKKVAGRLAGLALIPVPAARLDDAIRSAIEAASAPSPLAPASRLPDVLRAAILAFSAAMVVASGSESWLGGDPGPSMDTALLALEDAGPDGGSAAASESEASQDSVLGARLSGIPRPEDWDGGALARLAQGEPDFVGDAPRPAAPAPSAPAAAPTAAESPRVAPATPQPELPSAFRPSERGASAANSDPGSSEDERADALAGSVRTAASEIVIDRAVNDDGPAPAAASADSAAAGTQARRRTAVRAHDYNVLGEKAQALLDEATALVRTVALAAAPDDGALRQARRTGVRNVKRQVRNSSLPANGPPVPAGRKAAKLSRIYGILFDLALHEGAAPQSVRWPDGVDMADALAELIRLLTAPPRTDAERMPDIADDTPVAAELDRSRLPELE